MELRITVLGCNYTLSHVFKILLLYVCKLFIIIIYYFQQKCLLSGVDNSLYELSSEVLLIL
jgi:hypothetical protein